MKHPPLIRKLCHFFTPQVLDVVPNFSPRLSFHYLFLNLILSAVLYGLWNYRTSFFFLPSNGLTVLLRIVEGEGCTELGKRTCWRSSPREQTPSPCRYQGREGLWRHETTHLPKSWARWWTRVRSSWRRRPCSWRSAARWERSGTTCGCLKSKTNEAIEKTITCFLLQQGCKPFLTKAGLPIATWRTKGPRDLSLRELKLGRHPSF